jgi:Zn-dependent protease
MIAGDSILTIGVVLGVILVSMTLHEAIHGYVAYFLGDDTAQLEGRLTLNPIRHIDPFLTILLPLLLAVSGAPIFGGAKPVPFNPGRLKYDEWGAALVALGGPLTNLIIAFLAFGIGIFVGAADGLVSLILRSTVYVNLGFFVFNMIPIPPLDGSRVLYALAPDFFRRWMEQFEQFGVIAILVIVLLGSQFIGVYMSNSIIFFINLFNSIFAVV